MFVNSSYILDCHRMPGSIPAQYVKPLVKTNKNDFIDAEAMAEAAGRRA